MNVEILDIRDRGELEDEGLRVTSSATRRNNFEAISKTDWREAGKIRLSTFMSADVTLSSR